MSNIVYIYIGNTYKLARYSNLSNSGFEIIDSLESAAEAERAEHAEDFSQDDAHARGQEVDQVILQKLRQFGRTTLQG